MATFPWLHNRHIIVAWLTAAIVVCTVAEQEPFSPADTSRESTATTGPPDNSNVVYLDYVAELNERLGTGVVEAENAFVGLLGVMDTTDWKPAHRAGLERELGVKLDGLPGPVLVIDEHLHESMAGGVDSEDTLFERGYRRPWTPEQFPRLDAWVGAQSAALNRVAEAVRRPRYFAPLIREDGTASMIGLLLPQLGEQRRIARSVAVHAQRAIGTGDLDTAVQDIETLRLLADGIRHEPVVISNLVGVSIDAVAAEVATSMLETVDPGPGQARRLIELFPTVAGGLRMAETVDLGERRMGLDVIEVALALRSRGEQPRPERNPFDFQTDRLHRVAMHPMFDVQRGRDRFNAYYDELVDMLRLDDVRALEAEALGLQKKLDGYKQDPWKMKLFVEATLAPQLVQAPQGGEVFTDHLIDMFAAMLLPALDAARNTELRIESRRDLVRTGAALAGYRAEHGRFPETLAPLVPAWLDAVPRDLDGEPLRYQRLGDGYRLYSIGRDLEDDGGVPDIDGNEKEADIVIRTER